MASRWFVPLTLLALAAPGAHAQGGDQAVPEGFRPPPGMCRIWIEGVPPDRQPAPTDCATAVRRRPANAHVVFGDQTPPTNGSQTALPTNPQTGPAPATTGTPNDPARADPSRPDAPRPNVPRPDTPRPTQPTPRPTPPPPPVFLHPPAGPSLHPAMPHTPGAQAPPTIHGVPHQGTPAPPPAARPPMHRAGA